MSTQAIKSDFIAFYACADKKPIKSLYLRCDDSSI